MPKKVFSYNCILRTRVFEWHTWVLGGLEDIQDSGNIRCQHDVYLLSGCDGKQQSACLRWKIKLVTMFLCNNTES